MKINISPQLKVMLRVFKVSWSIRPSSVILYFIGAVAEIAAFLTTIFATAKIGALLAAYLTGDEASSSEIWFWLGVDIVAAVIIGLAFWLMRYAERLLYFYIVKWTTVNYVSKLCDIDFPDFYDEETRNRINKVYSGYSWQIANLSSSIMELMYSVMRFVAITIVVAKIGWWVVPVIIIFLIPSLIGESRVARIMWFVWDSKGDQRHIFWSLSQIMKQPRSQMEIRSTQLKNYLVNKIDKMNKIFYSEQESRYKNASKFLVPAKVFEVTGTAIGSIVLLRQVLSRSISLEQYFFLSGALLRVGGALNAIFGTLTRMQEQILFAENYFDLIDQKINHKDKDSATELKRNQPLEIEFKGVNFTYPGQSQKVFNNLNLTIKPGEHIAIIGENGAGKTTLIKLLLRFYKLDSGKILINGHNIEDIKLDSWYSLVATLFQEFNHYPFPIKENIEIARTNTNQTEDAFSEATKLAGVDKIVAKYKHGWETVLDPSFKTGIEPSGGQWQKVALARSFYRDAKLLILDEPTSAIDAKTEYDIFNNIFKHYKNKTAIIISHRFSTVRRASRIIVLDNGKIVEQGTHQELMAKKSLYQDMFTKQAEGYKD